MAIAQAFQSLRRGAVFPADRFNSLAKFNESSKLDPLPAGKAQPVNG